jgi:alkaline phosphatase D
VTASRSAFDCTLRRVETIKRRSRKVLTSNGYRYRLARGQKSIKGVNGPDA